MNKTIISIMAVMLCGCVDLGRVGLHPELKTAYFDGQKHIVESCLYSAALSQKLSLMKDDTLPGGTERYDLQDANYENVAWVDITPSGEKQTSAYFFYAPHDPDVHKSILSMIAKCQNPF